MFLLMQTLWVLIDSALFFGGVHLLKQQGITEVSSYQLLQLLPFLVLPFLIYKIVLTQKFVVASLMKLITILCFMAEYAMPGFIALGFSIALFNPLRYCILESNEAIKIQSMSKLESMTFLGMMIGVLLGGKIIPWGSITYILLFIVSGFISIVLYQYIPRVSYRLSYKKVLSLLKQRKIKQSLLATGLFFGIGGALKSLFIELGNAYHLTVADSTYWIICANIFIILGITYAQKKQIQKKHVFGIPLGLIGLSLTVPGTFAFYISLIILGLSAGLFFVLYNYDLHDESAKSNNTFEAFVLQNGLENLSAILFLLLMNGIHNVHIFLYVMSFISFIIIFFIVCVKKFSQRD